VVVNVETHPILNVVIFETQFSLNVEQISYPDLLLDILFGNADVPLTNTDEIQKSIRDLLRYGGYKPAGRGKPSSEYLQRTVLEKGFPKINPIVDVGNIISHYSGLPVSVIDRDRVNGPFGIRIGKENEKYIFNSSGQEIDLKGLLCFTDIDGPCATPVKDSIRSKISAKSVATITVLWGTRDLLEQVKKTFDWYVDLLSVIDSGCGATTKLIPVVEGDYNL
jgi:DNA/RNA-binding domain of Phe-tRNA-synthetase-like protein